MSQTLEDIEIIVVDDASTDKTPEILSDYAKRDKRIKIVRHPENCGTLWVRKTGIENASGDYIMFVDGDDSLEETACDRLYDEVINKNADMVVAGHRLYTIDGQTIPKIYNLNYGNDGRSLAKSMVMNEIPVMLCGNIYSIDLWKGRDLPYLKGFSFCDDLLLSFSVSENVRKVVVIPDLLYRYYKNEGSTTERKYDDRALNCMMISHARMMRVVSGYDDDMINGAWYKHVGGVFDLIKKGYSRSLIMQKVRDNGLSGCFTLTSFIKRLSLRKALIYWFVTHSDLGAAIAVKFA